MTVSSLLLSIGILLTANGLHSTLLALRAAEEGFGGTVIGIIMSMYFVGFIAGTFLLPGVIQRVGHIRTFATLAAVCASSMVLLGLWVDPVIWTLIRFLTGICIVGIFMVTESWLHTQASNENRGQLFAIYILVNLVFLATGQFLILAGDINSIELFAISAALFSISLVPVALTRIREPAPVAKINLHIGVVYKISALGFMGSFVSGFLGSLFWSFGPLYARASGMPELGIALFMSTIILGGIILQWPIGYWSDRRDRRFMLMMVSLLMVLSALLVMILPASTSVWLTISLFILGGMLFSIYPLSVAHTNDHPEANDSVAVTTNLLLIYGAGAAVGPLIGGLVMQLLGQHSLFGIFVTGGIFLGGYAAYWQQHGIRIRAQDKTRFTPLLRTSQAGIELLPDQAKQ